MPLLDFFKKYLGIDYWQGSPDIYLLAPAITRMKPGKLYPNWPEGQCVFLKDDRCMIHKAKPTECREYHCEQSEEESRRIRLKLVRAWHGEQKQCYELMNQMKN